MNKIISASLLLIATSIAAFATGDGSAVPEIGGASAGTAVALVSGALLVIRSLRRK